MAQIVSESILISHDALRDFACQCLERIGLTSDDAFLVADSLVESNLRGIDSHGIARLPHYLNRIRQGSINPRPQITFSATGAAIGRVDGDHGLGQLVMERATREALALAKDAGAGWVAVENSSHCGALAYYGLQIARAGMIGFVFTHSDSMVVPHAARKAFCGTNPICLTAPGAEGSTLCLDMATSVVPWNTITNAAIEGVPIPDTWAVNADGEPTTNPGDVRAVRPSGDYKGSGLGLMIDVLCSFLLGSPFGPHIPAMYGDASKRRHLGGLVGAIDVSRFRDLQTFRTAVKELCREWNAQVSVDLETPVLYPGQPEENTRRQRLEVGIPVGIHLCDTFREIAGQFDVPWPFPAI